MASRHGSPVAEQPPGYESRDHDGSSFSHSRARPKRHIRALLTLMVLVNLSWSLYQLPLNRVIERRLCREYYLEHDPSLIGDDGNVKETLCKVDDVQKGLGWIQGVMETTWVVGDFVMTIPLVSLVELYGRRPILWLNLVPRIVMLAWTLVVGYFEQFLPTAAIMASPIFSVLGGDCVFNSVVYALVASLTDDYVLRATYFSQMNAISSIFAFQLGPALASATMSVLIWLPFWIGIFLLFVSIPIIAALPSGRAPRRRRDSHDHDEQCAPLLSSPLVKAQDKTSSVVASIKDRVQTIKDILTSHPLNFALLLTCFFLTSLASSDTKLLTQYISKRYNWTFASVGYLLSGKAAFNFVFLTFVVPTVLRLRTGRLRAAASMSGSTTTAVGEQMSSPLSHTEITDRANVGYAKICLVLSVLGALAIALASTIWVLIPALLLYALGIALPIFTYSLLKSPAISPAATLTLSDGMSIGSSGGAGEDGEAATAAVTTGSETQIFSIVMLVKTVGLLVGAPLMATLWVRGIAAGGAALGLPFFVSSAVYALAVAVFSGIRI